LSVDDNTICNINVNGRFQVWCTLRILASSSFFSSCCVFHVLTFLDAILACIVTLLLLCCETSTRFLEGEYIWYTVIARVWKVSLGAPSDNSLPLSLLGFFLWNTQKYWMYVWIGYSLRIASCKENHNVWTFGREISPNLPTIGICHKKSLKWYS
jgi:hypothetical protein